MSNTIKLGIVGLGRAGYSMHLPELKGKENMFSIVAVCDIEKERCELMEKEFGCRSYSSIEEFVKDPEIEVVDIATRSCDHFEHARIALNAGKKVLLEKPMCCSYSDAKQLFDIDKQFEERRLFIRHNRRFEAKFMQVREIIESKILGDVYMIRLARDNFDRRHDWQTLRQYGGGQLLNWGPHIIDHSLRLCGGDYTSLTAVTKQIAASGDCEDYIKAIFKGVNGIIVDMEISGGTALKVPEYILYGTRGTLYDNGRTYTIRYLDPNVVLPELVADPSTPLGATFAKQEPLPFKEEEIEWNKNDLDHTWTTLYDALRCGIDYPIKSDEALKVMETIDEIKNQTN